MTYRKGKQFLIIDGDRYYQRNIGEMFDTENIQYTDKELDLIYKIEITFADYFPCEKIFDDIQNVNQLPYVSSLASDEIYEGEDGGYEELYDRWDEVKLTLEDGTRVALERCAGTCLKHKPFDSYGKYFFYHLVDDDVYICADCLTWLKKREKLISKIDNSKYGLIDDNILFPIDWNEQGARAWIKKKVISRNEHQSKINGRKSYYESIEIDNCIECIYMKKGNCEFGLYCDYDEECDSCERR